MAGEDAGQAQAGGSRKMHDGPGRPASATPARCRQNAADKKPAPRRVPQQPADERAVVNAFAAHALVQERLACRKLELKGTRGGAKGSRTPTSLRAIERRWFTGRLTVAKAAEFAKTAELRAQLDAGVATSDALVGTATLLALSQDGSGLAELMPMDTTTDLRELRLRIKTLVHGGATMQGARRTVDQKKYFLHQSIVTACLRHAQRQQQPPPAASLYLPGPETVCPSTARAVALWGQRYGARAPAVVDRPMGLSVHAGAAGPTSDDPATSHGRAGCGRRLPRASCVLPPHPSIAPPDLARPASEPRCVGRWDETPSPEAHDWTGAWLPIEEDLHSSDYDSGTHYDDSEHLGFEESASASASASASDCDEPYAFCETSPESSWSISSDDLHAGNSLPPPPTHPPTPPHTHTHTVSVSVSL